MLNINKSKTIHEIGSLLDLYNIFYIQMDITNQPFLRFDVQATAPSPNIESGNICPFKILYSHNPIFSTYMNKLIPQEQTQLVCWLQIFQGHIYVLNSAKNKIIFTFKISLSYKVEISNLLHVQHDLVTIRFIFPSPENYQIVMQILDLKTFNNFYAELRLLQIFQLHFHNHFRPLQRIGKGSVATVFRSSSNIFPFEVAVRALSRHHSSPAQLFQQVSIQKSLSHPCICQLLEIYLSEDSIYMVMKLQRRNLLSHLFKFDIVFSACKTLMKRLAEGVVYLHECGIMHRDLKLENIMVCDNRNQNIRPIIVDFGLATRQIFSKKVCGTYWYIAPQIIARQVPYTKQCDIYSLGKTFFFLLFKKIARQWINTGNMKRTETCIIDFEQNCFAKTPIQLKDLLSGMLQIDPRLRLTAPEVLHHAFFTEPLIIPEHI